MERYGREDQQRHSFAQLGTYAASKDAASIRKQGIHDLGGRLGCPTRAEVEAFLAALAD
jgi:hypothetical protein